MENYTGIIIVFPNILTGLKQDLIFLFLPNKVFGSHAYNYYTSLSQGNYRAQTQTQASAICDQPGYCVFFNLMYAVILLSTSKVLLHMHIHTEGSKFQLTGCQCD